MTLLEQFEKDSENFYDNLKKQCINPKGKVTGHINASQATAPAITPSKYKNSKNSQNLNYSNRLYGYETHKPSGQCCLKPEKYKNVVTKSMQFWSCKNCGSDLGDLSDSERIGDV